MFCSACGKKTPDDPCPHCGASVRLKGRWRLDDVAGSGTFGTTWRALDTTTGFTVAVKECRLAGLSDKVVQLGRREAEVLAQLDHPGIPRFVDAFELGEGRRRSLYLVTEFIHGLTLEQERGRRRYTEDEVLDLAEELLGVLRYLHSLSPPVVHRDIKPSNLIRRAPGNRLVLIDFGAVRDVLTDGATTVGTFGYMAPEQGTGGGTPASDLYALGALMVVCLTRQEPKKLANRRGRLEWHGKATVRPRTEALIDALLDPDPDKRPGHDQVRAELRAARKEPLPIAGSTAGASVASAPSSRPSPKRGRPPGPTRAKRGSPPGPVERSGALDRLDADHPTQPIAVSRFFVFFERLASLALFSSGILVVISLGSLGVLVLVGVGILFF